MTKTMLSGIAHTSGRSLPIDQAAQSPQHQRVCASLRDEGFDRFILSDLNIVDLIGDALSTTLQRSQIAAEDVDAVIFATETFWDTDIPRFKDVAPDYRRIRDGLVTLLRDFGLRAAYPYANWLSSCANLAPSLALAKALVESGQHERVLVIVADKQPPVLGPVMSNGAAVFSDMAASCIVDERETGYQLEHVVVHAAPALAEMRSADAGAQFVLETNRAMKTLARKFRARVGRGCDGYPVVCTNNYHLHSLKIILDGLGIRPVAVRRDVRAEVAHGHGADSIITLDALSRRGLLASGDEALLLMTGVYCWGMATVRCAGS